MDATYHQYTRRSHFVLAMFNCDLLWRNYSLLTSRMAGYRSGRGSGNERKEGEEIESSVLVILTEYPRVLKFPQATR